MPASTIHTELGFSKWKPKAEPLKAPGAVLPLGARPTLGARPPRFVCGPLPLKPPRLAKPTAPTGTHGVVPQ
jgi:hypothetical protein